MPQPLDVSVIIPSYNRASVLPGLIDRLLEQDAANVRYEILVVDNNSTDHTCNVVQRAIARDTSGRLRYAFEGRQGASHARNTGVEQTIAPIILFLDDDGVPGRDWVRSMKAAFDAHPEADCIGGRVKAEWRVPPPSWMEQAHTGPFAIQDWPGVVHVNAQKAQVCLITANIGFRREVFTRIGGFSPEYQRNEDHEFELRMWRAGMQGLYLPEFDVTVAIPPERMTRRYHRQWRLTTGKYHARMRFRDSLAPDGALLPDGHRGRTFLGVPLFMYREFLSHVVGWMRALILFRSNARFLHETRICYYAGFLFGRVRRL